MRQPRFFEPDATYEVVCRTLEGKRLLRPVAELTDGVHGVLGRALDLS